ncbi:hypothetical protein [Aquabacter cavernae]|uniref:hypothetical protein n=1 Tax=Aquabacter cavernae TaxID=2496029 RepID=UPI000F8EF170|nr:hypothetical protein [Aquabacter cavernae]
MEALANRDAAAAAAARTHAEIEAAETEEREARALLARLNTAVHARDAVERLAEMERKLAVAESVRVEIETEEAALALLKMPETALSELEALAIEIAKLRAPAEADSASVKIAYAPDTPLAIGLPVLKPSCTEVAFPA